MKAFDCFRKREYLDFGEPCNIPEEHKQVSTEAQTLYTRQTRPSHVELRGFTQNNRKRRLHKHRCENCLTPRV